MELNLITVFWPYSQSPDIQAPCRRIFCITLFCPCPVSFSLTLQTLNLNNKHVTHQQGLPILVTRQPVEAVTQLLSEDTTMLGSALILPRHLHVFFLMWRVGSLFWGAGISWNSCIMRIRSYTLPSYPTLFHVFNIFLFNKIRSVLTTSLSLTCFSRLLLDIRSTFLYWNEQNVHHSFLIKAVLSSRIFNNLILGIIVRGQCC